MSARGGAARTKAIPAVLRAGAWALATLLVLATAATAQGVRLKDLVDFGGVRGNDLVGYGLVVGLAGTGDGLRNAPFTEEIMTSILERMGVNVTGEQFRPRNVAAVIVTAELPAFARTGSRIDVSISAIGDAESLLGGTLVMTPLTAADGEVYAVAQGAVIAGGATSRGDAARVTEGVPTAGIISSGARVEREVSFAFESLTQLRLALREPDFTTAGRVERAIDAALGRGVARMIDAGTVLVDVRRARLASPAHVVGRLEGIEIVPERRARVVVDQKSGTIVMGRDVRISEVAVAQNNLTLQVEEAPAVVQPSPFGDGQTVVVPRTGAALREEPGPGLSVVRGGTSLSEVIAGLNALGVSARDMIDILQTISAAGALHAELVVR